MLIFKRCFGLLLYQEFQGTFFWKYILLLNLIFTSFVTGDLSQDEVQSTSTIQQSDGFPYCVSALSYTFYIRKVFWSLVTKLFLEENFILLLVNPNIFRIIGKT